MDFAVNIQFIKNLNRRHFSLIVMGICLAAFFLSAAAFFCVETVDDDEFSFDLQSNLNFQHTADTPLIEKSQQSIISIALQSIHDRSPPIV